MFDTATIKTNLITLAGLRQTDNPDYPQLDAGILYDGANLLIDHPLINIENIDLTARNYSLFNYAAYVALTTYATGNRVTYSSVVYESLADANLGNQPDINPLSWKVINSISLYLEDRFKSAAVDVVNEVFTRKKIHRQSKTLLANMRLTEGVGGFNDIVVNTSSLVGIEIKLKYNQNIMAVINRIGMQINQANANLPMYLYHSSQQSAIATLNISYTGTGSMLWTTVDTKLYFSSSDYVGGVFYLMYDQDALTGAAIKKKHNCDKPPCAYCNRSDVDNYNLYSKYMIIRTVQVNSANRNGVDLWDLSKTTYVPDNNFGLNFEFTIKCDLTDFIVQQKSVFAYAFRDAVTLNILRDIMYSTRENGTKEKLQLMARSELQDTKIGGLGMVERYEKQLEGVDFEMSDLDDVCLPCNTKSGMRVGTSGLRNW